MGKAALEVTALLQQWGERMALLELRPCISSPPLDGGTVASPPASRIPPGVDPRYSAVYYGHTPAAVVHAAVMDQPVDVRNVAFAHYVQAVSRDQVGIGRTQYYARLERLHSAVQAALERGRSSDPSG